MTEETNLVEHEEIGAPLSISTIKHQTKSIQDVMRDVMVEGIHYGKIPGVDKPILFQSGAEKLCLTFRLAPTYHIETIDLGSGHREVKVKCTLTHIPSGKVFGEGAGSCSTMERKYRYRKSERLCPKCGKSCIIKGKAEYGGGWVCFSKKGGCGAKFKDDDKSITSQEVGHVENTDIADTYNTVLKIAQKRAYVGTVKSALAASDIVTVDMEDEQTTIPDHVAGSIVMAKELSREREYEEAEVVEPRAAEKPKPSAATVSDDVMSRVHNDTLYALEVGDSKLMAEAWKGFGADEKVTLWNMFNSAQRSAIKRLQGTAK